MQGIGVWRSRQQGVRGGRCCMCLSCPRLICILHGAPPCLAAHQGRSVRSSLLSTPAHLGLRSLGDTTDSGWAGGSKGGTAGHTPSLPKDRQERKGATKWVHLSAQRMATPHTWLLLFPGFAHSPHPEHGSPAWAHTQQHLLGSAALMP